MKRDPLELLGLAGRVALVALPAALTLYLSFNAGGFFPDSVSFASILVLQALLLRTTIAADPVAGFRSWAAVPAVALALFTGWALLSGAWSDAPGRALTEANRALLYTLVFVLFASVVRRADTMRWMVRGVAFALVVVSTTGLLSWLFPHEFDVDLGPAADRLAYPITYWNALGVMAAMGVILCLHLAADRREPIAVKAVAAGAVPVLAVTILFTFSRGAIVAGAIGVVLYLLLRPGAGQLAAVAVTAPLSALALVKAYGAEELADTDPTLAVAVAQGRDVAEYVAVLVVVAVLARAVVALVGRHVVQQRVSREREERAAKLAWLGVLVAVVVVMAAIDMPGRVSSAVDAFFHGPANPAASTDLRDRLPAAASSGRVHQWEVAVDGFAEEPLRGHGAGTYEHLWYENRNPSARIKDAHSLYVEVLGELGLVGIVLLAIALGGIVVALALRVRGPNRSVYAALTAAAVTWIVHASADWHWEMPATGLWLFALGGAAAARRAGPSSEPRAAKPARWPVAVALGWLVIGVGPLLVMLSEGRLAQAEAALARRDCTVATDKALASIEVLGVRREAYEVLGFCQALRGFPRQGMEAMARAVDTDPRSWEAHFALAVLRAQAGEDPRPQLVQAGRLNPKESLVAEMLRRVRAAPPEEWPQIGAETQESALQSAHLTILDD